MDFGILGPVEGSSGGEPLVVGGPRQRALLAYLLLHANEVVAADRLLHELWWETPRGSLAALQTQISRLRRVVGARLRTVPPGYSMRVEPGELDLHRFRALLADAASCAEPAERARLLRAAEGLWRGEPLAGLDLPFVAGEQAALEELRLGATEERLDAELACGLDAELVPELGALAARHPLREHLRCLLMLALYRADRQAEALEAYREARRVLADELGLEPSAALRDLELAILRQDPLLERPSRAPAAAPAPAAPVTSSAPRRRRFRPAPLAGFVVVGAAGVAAALVLFRSAPPVLPLQAATLRRHAQLVHVHVRHGVRSVQPRLVVARKRRPALAPVTRRVTKRPERHVVYISHRVSHRSPPRRKQPVETVHAVLTTTTVVTTRTAPATTTATAATTTPPGTIATISDSFAGTQVDGTIWYEIETGTGWTLTQQNGYVEFAFTPDAAPGGQYDQFGGHLGSQCKFPGDFDATVDFSLPSWPAGNGVTVNLWAFVANTGWAAWRESSPQWGELYGSYTGPGASAGVALDDASGSLRLVRANGVLTAYFLHRGVWEALSSSRETGLATIAIGANGSSSAGFAGGAVAVDFGDFVVSGDDPVCPAGSRPAGSS
jgi:DNA-binding SARP family transcriptional activator